MSTVADGLGKAAKVTAALAAACVLLWIGFCGPLATQFDPPGGSYGPTGFFGNTGVLFFLGAVVLVPLTGLLVAAWVIRWLVQRARSK